MPEESNSPEVTPETTISPGEPPDGAAMSDRQLAEAKRYGRWEVACGVADKLLDVAYLAVAALLLAVPLDGWLAGTRWLGHGDSLRLAVLFLVVTAGHIAVSFPLSFFSGYVLEHRFELSRQSLPAWFWQYAKRNLLAAAFGTVLMLGLYWLIWGTGSYWWLTAAAAFFVVSVVLGQLAPVLIMPLFYKIEKFEAGDLAERIKRLAEGTGLSIEGVYRMVLSDETVKANAMLAGLGRTRRVLLGDTLLDGFTPDEIEVVFAHEIGHHVHNHIWKLLSSGVLFSLAGFWICDCILAAWVGGPNGAVDYGTFPVYALPMVMLVLTLFGLVLEPIQNAVSRRFERQADRYALERTGMADAYRTAFRKLAKINKDDPDPHPLDVILFHSHPPIAERLAMAEKSE